MRNKKECNFHYSFNIGAEALYEGALYEEYKDHKGKIINRNHNRKGKEFYKLLFDDGETLVIMGIVMKLAMPQTQM